MVGSNDNGICVKNKCTTRIFVLPVMQLIRNCHGKAHVYEISNMAAPTHIQHNRANVCESITETEIIMRRYISERTIANF